MKKHRNSIVLILWGISGGLAFFFGYQSLNSDANERVSDETFATGDESPSTPPSQNPFLSQELPEVNPGGTFFETAMTEPEEAFRSIKGKPEDEIRQLLAEAFKLPPENRQRWELVAGLLEELAQKAPEEALKLTGDISSLPVLERTRQKILETWARKDPDRAFAASEQFFEGYPEQTRFEAKAACMRGYADIYPEKAFRKILSLAESSDGEKRLNEGLLQTYFRQQLANGRSEEAMIQCASIMDPNLRFKVRKAMIQEWSDYDPFSASQYISTLEAGAQREGLGRQLLAAWPDHMLSSAADWIVSLQPDFKNRNEMAITLALKWDYKDADRTYNWLEALPQDGMRDEVILGFINGQRTNPGSVAARAASLLSDPDLREEKLKLIRARLPEAP